MDNDFLNQISVAELPKCTFANIEKESEKLFNEDVIDENNIDDWTIDDFLGALPETIFIKHGFDALAGFTLYYSINLEDSYWISGYKTLCGNLINESIGETPLEAVKNLYIKLKDNEELEYTSEE